MTGLIIVGVWPGQARTPRDNDISMCENLGSARGQNFMSDDDAINYLTSASHTCQGWGNTACVCREHFINTDIIMERINLG